MEQHQFRGQTAVREKSQQTEGEVWEGEAPDASGASTVEVPSSSLTCSPCPPQDVAAYRQKTKGGPGSAGKAPAKVEKKAADDDDDDDEDEDEEEDDDDDDDE